MQEQINQLKQQIDAQNTRINYLEGVILNMAFSDRYVFEKHLQLADGKNIQCARRTGTKIGTATDQKIAFYGVTPVVQQGAISAPNVGSVAGGDTVSASAVGTNFTNLKTAVDSIRTALINFGITA